MSSASGARTGCSRTSFIHFFNCEVECGNLLLPVELKAARGIVDTSYLDRIIRVKSTDEYWRQSDHCSCRRARQYISTSFHHPPFQNRGPAAVF